jgi:demethylmenaquinone methyltransferase/2-methoxy-6-polyprenyl-1,4-benzoquinol methylase
MEAENEHQRALFNDIAKDYDERSVALSWGGLRSWHRAACAWLKIAPGDHVLDVGCGTGVVLRRCAARVEGRGTFVGLDRSAAMLDIARRCDRSTGGAGIHWIEADGQNLPFADSTFDWVTAQFSLRNMAEWEHALREMVRVLKPAGHLVILDLVRPRAGFGRAALFYINLVTRLPGLGPYQEIPRSVTRFATGPQLLTAIDAALPVGAVKEWVGGLVMLVVARKGLCA